MRKIQNIEEEEQLQKEMVVMKEVNMSREEVEKFRELYLTVCSEEKAQYTFVDTTLPPAAHQFCYMSFESMLLAVRDIIPLGDKNKSLLTDIFQQHSSATGWTDFPDFLKMMQAATRAWDLTV